VTAKSGARTLLRRFGVDVVRYPAGTAWGATIQHALEDTRPDVLVDVGACHGEFAAQCRALGYNGPIVSFEPAASAVAVLERRAAYDSRWIVRRVALGDEVGEAELHVGADPQLNSLLRPDARAAAVFAGLQADDVERVPVARLDAVLEDVAPGAQRVFLKVDAQGYDLRVLEGAVNVLERVVAIHVELSIQPVYEGSPDYLTVLGWLRERGFEPAGIVSRATLGPLLAEADCLLRRPPERGR
jgi:FkbM family methyltransferase